MKQYFCPSCDETFNLSSSLRDHVHVEHPPRNDHELPAEFSYLLGWHVEEFGGEED